jgi:inner membrane protein
MASIGHVAVGMAAGRHLARRAGMASATGPMIVLSALSLLPDLDVVGFAAGIPYGAPFGHRGASHSLLAAAVVGVVAMIAAATWRPAREVGVGALRVGITVAIVVATHGVLDAMTDGGKGVALLWPFSTERFFLPWRPIPVAPIGVGMVSARGVYVALIEVVEFAPLVAYALLARVVTASKATRAP